MSLLDNSAEMLSEFGLTPYEAKVYLAVVKLGLTSAGKIAKVASIRREEVYRTLPKLEKAGLVERVLGRPIQVRALPVDDALTILIERKRDEAEREISELTTKRETLLTSLQTDTAPIQLEEERSNFVLISEKDALAKRTDYLIGQAVREIAVAETEDNVVRFVIAFSDALSSTVSRDVKVRLITECPEDEKKIPDLLDKSVLHNHFALRYIDSIHSRYMIFDNREALMTTSAEGSLSDSKCLWTDDRNLVRIMQRDFEDLFRDSIDWKSYEVTSETRLARILDRLQPRDHVILVYDSQEAKRWALFNYIKNGLEGGEAARYVCSEESPDEIRDALVSFGIDVEKYEKSGGLGVIPYDSLYIKDGEFDVPSVMDAWEAHYNEAMDRGFKGLRVTGEMGCFIEHSLVNELIEYEKALHTILDIPMTAICAYNAHVLAGVDNPIDVYSELVRAHGKVLYADKDDSVGSIEIRIG